MIDFPNIRSESDFVRAYVRALTALRRDIVAYVAAHGFEEAKNDSIFVERGANLYMGLTDEVNSGRISQEVMDALAFLFHNELREMAAECGHLYDDSAIAAAEYAKVQHVVDRALKCKANSDMAISPTFGATRPSI